MLVPVAVAVGTPVELAAAAAGATLYSVELKHLSARRVA